MSTPQEHPYQHLLPETVLDAVEAAGFHPTGSFYPLNSYENRVYDLVLEDDRHLIAKFYRPERLSDAAILEEHGFAQELTELEIPVLAPLANDAGETLHRHAGFRLALYPRVGGRWPELEDPDTQYRLGQLLGRIHAVGAVRPFDHRPAIDVEDMGWTAYRLLLEGEFIPPVHRAQYQALAGELLSEVEQRLSGTPWQPIRLHGDFHPGNILQRDEQITIVDTDDCRIGPAVQDLWLLLSGEREQMLHQLGEIIEGYEEFHSFPLGELTLIEALRALRIIHYTGWLAKRWRDPAFPHHFPWFGSERYWDEHIMTLREQSQRLAEPALSLGG